MIKASVNEMMPIYHKHFNNIPNGGPLPLMWCTGLITPIFKRECPRGPREITKMWHMLEKLISLIFCREKPHDELINVVYLFCSDLLLFSRKFAKIVRDAEPLKNRGHWSAEYQHKNLAPEK